LQIVNNAAFDRKMWESFIQFDDFSPAPGEAVHKLITETRLQRPRKEGECYPTYTHPAAQQENYSEKLPTCPFEFVLHLETMLLQFEAILLKQNKIHEECQYHRFMFDFVRSECI
jgi:hypothetical protein